MIASLLFFMKKFNFYHFKGIIWGKKSSYIDLLNFTTMITFFNFPLITNYYKIIFPISDSAFEIALGEKKMFKIAGLNIIEYFPIISLIFFILKILRIDILKKFRDSKENHKICHDKFYDLRE